MLVGKLWDEELQRNLVSQMEINLWPSIPSKLTNNPRLSGPARTKPGLPSTTQQPVEGDKHRLEPVLLNTPALAPLALAAEGLVERLVPLLLHGLVQAGQATELRRLEELGAMPPRPCDLKKNQSPSQNWKK